MPDKVFSNNQIPWIQSCAITIGISLLLPILLSVPITALRFIGMRSKMSIMYKIAGILYDFI